jgi:hypothetical protein
MPNNKLDIVVNVDQGDVLAKLREAIAELNIKEDKAFSDTELLLAIIGKLIEPQRTFDTNLWGHKYCKDCGEVGSDIEPHKENCVFNQLRALIGDFSTKHIWDVIYSAFMPYEPDEEDEAALEAEIRELQKEYIDEVGKVPQSYRKFLKTISKKATDDTVQYHLMRAYAAYLQEGILTDE